MVLSFPFSRAKFLLFLFLPAFNYCLLETLDSLPWRHEKQRSEGSGGEPVTPSAMAFLLLVFYSVLLDKRLFTSERAFNNRQKCRYKEEK